ncbi:MAG: peptidoglycan DD-metalloendopeptidase family protein [Bacteroidaceae bacterium]|nr:peptidoglycan DD-metalloendopeptidase family protein [Bacteroidaceae bacterium]
MKRILHTILALCLSVIAYGQTNPKVKEMTNQRAKIEQEISESQRLLTSAKKDVDGQLAQLSALTAQIKKQQQYVDKLNADVKAIDKEMKSIEEQLITLRLELERRREHYAKALQLMANKNSFENRLMFLLSADTFNQMVRRMRYLREYSEFQRKQGELLVQQQKELDNKQAELEDTRKEKQKLLTKRIEEKKVLDKQVAEQKQLIAGLKKKQKDISNRIAKQQSERNKLNEEIERIIKAEIAAQKKAQKKEEATAKDTTSPKESSKEMPAYRESASDKKLTGSFESNKGRLPAPITGPYLITSHYGVNYVEGLKNVKFNNHGIDLQGKEGCSAKAIFDGTVSYVFQHMQNEGSYIVMVRHGQYISAYFNLTNLTVKKGDKVKTNEPLGTISANGTGNYVMQFQLRKDTQSLNPELWLGL